MSRVKRPSPEHAKDKSCELMKRVKNDKRKKQGLNEVQKVVY